MRRCTSTARSNSMSCSVMAAASASHGIRPAGGAQPGKRPHDAADQRIAAEGGVERGKVVVDADHEAHPLDRARRGGLAPRPRAEHHAIAGGSHHADQYRLVALMNEPLKRATAQPQQAVGRAGAPQVEGPGGRTVSRNSTRPSARVRSSGPSARSGAPRTTA
jgi:hypothetical protein